MTFEEWWIARAKLEESDDLDALDLGQQVILAGWVKKSWDAAIAEARAEIEGLRAPMDCGHPTINQNILSGKITGSMGLRSDVFCTVCAELAALREKKLGGTK